eukprot:UN01049
MASYNSCFKCFNEVFPLQTKVILQNLKAEKYNGKHGIIVSCLDKKNPERFGVRMDDEKESKTIKMLKPSNLMTANGVPVAFVCELNEMKIPCKATLGVNSYYNEVIVNLLYSDHMGLDALKPAAKRFFGEECDGKDIVGESFGILTTALNEYRTKPKEIAIAMYKNKELAKNMEKNGLIKFTQKTVQQGYGEFSIAKICFQQMFYHNVIMP